MSPEDPFLRPDVTELQPEESALPNDLIAELDQALENITLDTAPEAAALPLEVPTQNDLIAEPNQAQENIALDMASEADVPPNEVSTQDDLIAELDKALETITLDKPHGEVLPFEVPTQDGMSMDPGIREMQETFLSMVRNFLRPVDRYLKAIAHGDNSRELLEIAEHIVAPLVQKTEAVGLREHTEDLMLFRSLLQFALGERDSSSFESMKGVVVRGFEKIQQRFVLERFRGSRPAVRNVVAFYRVLRDEGKVSSEDLARFFSIGLPSVTWLRRTPIFDLVSLSGISTDVIRTIQRQAFEARFGQTTKESEQDMLAPVPVATTNEEMTPIETVDIDLLDSWEDASFGPTSDKNH